MHQHFVVLRQGGDTVVLQLVTELEKTAVESALAELVIQAQDIENQCIERAIPMREDRHDQVIELQERWDKAQPLVEQWNAFTEAHHSWVERLEEYESAHTGMDDAEPFPEPAPKPPEFTEEQKKSVSLGKSPRPEHFTIPERLFDGTVKSAFRDVITAGHIEQAISGTVALVEYDAEFSLVDYGP